MRSSIRAMVRKEMLAMPPDILAPVHERDFLIGHKAVMDDYEQYGGEHSMARTVGILCDHFPRLSEKPSKIMTRIQALTKILNHPLMKAWKIEGLPEGGILLEETVLRVAARHPVTVTETDWLFEPQSFFSEVLKRAKRTADG